MPNGIESKERAVRPSAAISAKLKRLATQSDCRPRVLDLFAGCGGLSLGFSSAGFEILAAVEIDPLAARSHASNLFKGQPQSIIDRHALPRDIRSTDPMELARELGLHDPAMAFDVLIGGPPCQAYARVGRAKLREVADHPLAFKIDPRANLYLRYLHYVDRLQPLALLMENVPDILNFGGHNIVEEMVETLSGMGYEASYSLLNAAHYGVPQMRERVFMVAFHRDVGASIQFPPATHKCDLPSGYRGTRAVALKLINRLSVGGYLEADAGNEALPAAIAAQEAIKDLPPVTLHREGKLKRGARRFTELATYRKIPLHRLSAYALAMRAWPGFEAGAGVYDHVLRSLPRDTKIFEAMLPGDEYPAALALAETMFRRKAKRRNLRPNSARWLSLRKTIVPPYDPTKFPNRWWKLRPDGPVRTLTAHIGKDTYSHIHYDSQQGRVITVREAARLQSFPDGFSFSGTMNSAFRQIGNSVPPLFARAIATSVMQSLALAITPAIAAE